MVEEATEKSITPLRFGVRCVIPAPTRRASSHTFCLGRYRPPSLAMEYRASDTGLVDLLLPPGEERHPRGPLEIRRDPSGSVLVEDGIGLVAGLEDLRERYLLAPHRLPFELVPRPRAESSDTASTKVVPKK